MTPREPKSIAPTPGMKPHTSGDHPLSRTRKATTACQACQKRKSKCIGGEPCEPCQKANTECIFNADNDGRRRITLKRKIESLERDRELFLRLVESIRNRDDQSSLDVFDLIQSDAPLDEIRSYLARGQQASSAAASRDSDERTKLLKRSPSIYMDVRRLTDMPPFEVPAKPWTTVTDDDAFVSHLISLYFTWQQPTFRWIDRDLFLVDMKAGKKDSRFCSPLLVNILLTVACFHSDYPEAFANPDDPTTRGEHFFAEAVDLLKKEEGRIPLTTFQAWGDMYASACVMGKDRLGWQYLLHAADAMNQVMNKRQRMIKDAKEQSEEMARSIDGAISGLSSFIPTSALCFQKPPLIKKPVAFTHFPEDHDPSDTWTPYPRQTESIPAHTNCVINAHSNLATVIWDICDYLFRDDKPPTVDIEVIDSFHQRLQEVTSNLPNCIRLGQTPTVGAMELHMRYYNTIMVMFGFATATLEEDDTATKERIKMLRMSSAYHIGALLNFYRSQWPVEGMPMAFMQYSTLSLFTLLDDLHDKQNQLSFIENLTALRALARRWQMAKGMLRLVQLTAIKQETPLPDESAILFKDFEVDTWTAEDRESFSSHYPNFALVMKQRAEDAAVSDVDLDLLIGEWDSLTLTKGASEDGGPEGELEEKAETASASI